ncbi:TerC/Alx family metal homeostasis membrane protein [Mucilaginibacter myungsuensis]|uniref:TerC/Alx family metal homeostasis membrane protein n=1 Tax=Mucilaginibacter myungsuensis TaxID=649104 RepID=A0A929L680_9SPHI|nr:TerC/Alx family metal homeostasis membrane protein [Mucilaginibacter myungsuensis]MBE9663946.1 TerC/Alx family metal homeostasis membrane protein [Mucilaginibacter myungsuensis]MDN3598338.1 TerC/Alx family metal homeostasis membrane protein [Mucilaginibacter myungsuensis]
MSNELWIMIGFVAFIFLMMAIDMGLFGKSEHAVSLKQAGITSAVWVGMAIGFYFLVLNFGDRIHGVDNMARLQQINADHFHKLKLPDSFDAALLLYKKNLALEFITGYTIEYALSVDNIFVMVLIFSAFGVESKYYHKVLIWGIIGALIMRFLFIFVGAALINNFHWILYVFGVFLIYTGVTMFINRNKEDKVDPQNHPVVKFASRYFSVHPRFEGGKFFIKIDKKKLITPLFLVLLIIEATDLVFAIDSIPAIFSVTKDPYIVFFSNIFAIMGLRSMFFLLVNVIDKFHYLKTGLAVLLAFIGVKMLVGEYAEHIGLTTMRSLIIILAILVVSVVASLVFPKKKVGRA